MDRKASRGRKREKCGMAKNSDMNGRKTNQKEMEAEAPISRQAGGVCGGTKVPGASKPCHNGSPHLDIGKGEGLNGSATVAPSEAHEGSRQCKTQHEIHQSERTGDHGDETTHRNTETEEVNSTEEGACLEQLTPEQQRILLEKRELEQLLEQTKQLQQRAEMCLNRKDEKNSVESEHQGYACKQSELSKSLKGLSPGRKEATKRTATVVPHNQKAPLSTQEPDEFSVLSENAPVSLRGNIQLLEENAELLHKKVELEVLLQTANVLLEQTNLPELNQTDDEDLSFADNTCDVSFKSPDDSGKLEAGTTNVEDDSEQPENRSLAEILYEKADEITRKAKQFVDMLHEDKDLGSKQTQLDLENPKLLLQNSELESDKTDDSPSKCLVQKANTEEEEKASQAEKKGSLKESANCTEGDQEVKETDEVDDRETLEQKLELQRLLQQTRQLLEKVNSPLWPDSGTKEADKSLQETEELSRTAENKAAEGEMVSNLDQKEHREFQLPFEVTTAENKMPSGVKNEVHLEGIEIDKQDSGVKELQFEEVTNNAAHDIQPVDSETLEADKRSWSEVQTALLCEKNELSLLLVKTQLLQQQAEMIMTRSHLTTGKSDLKENILAPLPNSTQLSPHETTEMLHTAELTSEITKPDLETTGIVSKELKQTLDTTQQSSETTKEEFDTILLSSETTKPTLETTEVSSEKITPTLDMTKICSEATNPDLKTKEKSSGQNIQASDKISLPPEIISQKITTENLKTLSENSVKIGVDIPQEEKSTDENLQITECTKYIDDIKDESNDLNPSDLRTAILREADPKTMQSLPNNEDSEEDTQSDNNEDSESSDEDDPSYDPKEQLRQLLQRAKLLIERSKLPVSERQPSPQSDMCPPPGSVTSSEQEKEPNNPEPSTSEMAAGKHVELSTEENEGSQPKKQVLNSEIMNKTDVSLQQTTDIQNEIQLSQDAELELLLAKTKLMKLKADELLNQFKVSEPNSALQLPNSELSNENKVQLKQKADELHTQINISETKLDQPSENTQLPNEENKVVSGLESCATLPTAQGRQEESKDAEQPKRPTELNLDVPTVEQNIDSRTTVPEKEIHESAVPLNEDSQLELEEIEESHLEISENEKSQFEIEDEYLSDNSELSEMNMYYEDAEYSQDEEENLPKENEAVGNETCLAQSQQQTEAAEKKDTGTYNEKRELELLLEITKLLLEKATLPLELIETIPDESSSPALTESVAETAELVVKADRAGEELNLSLNYTIPVLETKQMCSQKTQTVTESTAMSLEKTGTVIETKEVPSQKSGIVIETTEVPTHKTETVTETTAMSLEKTGTVIETTEVPSTKTETVTETTEVPSHRTETVRETTEVPSSKSGIVIETTEVPLSKTETVTETTEVPSSKTETVRETTEVPSSKTGIVIETTEVPSSKTGIVIETTEVPSSKTETVTETTAMSSEKTGTVIEITATNLEKTGTVIETKEVPSHKTETFTETTAMSLEKPETVTETTEISSETSTPIQKVSKMLSDISKTQPEASHTTHMSQEQPIEDMTSSEISQKLQQLKTEVASFLQSELHNKTENSPMAENSLQNKADEANAENNAMLTTDKPEEAHPDHSTSKVIIKGTSNEQGSELQAEATAGVPDSHMEAGTAADLDNKPLKGWTPMTSYTLLLKLQNQMAKMQLQLSNLQDAMRTTNGIIQQLMDEAFAEM